MLGKIKNHKRLTGLLVVLFIGCGVAAAAWLIQSHGQGRAAIGTLSAPTITAGSLPGSPSLCSPGGDCSAYLHIVNPNGPMMVTGTLTGDGTTGVDPGGCPPTNLSVNVLTGLSIPVTAGTSDIVVPGAFHLATSAPTACQGQNLTTDIKLQFSTP
jgi:hypothetical protein